MNQYMTPDHPDAFLDWPKPAASPANREQLCPRCQGHGGWNLLLNQYRLPPNSVRGRYPDTPENRHIYCHFRSQCGHCAGWGWVSRDEKCTGHDWELVANTGRCLNMYRCVHCDARQEVDSSD